MPRVCLVPIKVLNISDLFNVQRNAWLKSIYTKGGKAVSPMVWLVMAEPVPAPKWREEQLSDSSGNMETHAMHPKHKPPFIQFLVASHLWATARETHRRTFCITSAWAFLSASPWGSSPPITHPAILPTIYIGLVMQPGVFSRIGVQIPLLIIQIYHK